jgi:cephalosporin-C deacetylase-like acetyl esterase
MIRPTLRGISIWQFGVKRHSLAAVFLLAASTAAVADEPAAPKPAVEFAEIVDRGLVKFQSGDSESTVPERFRLETHEFEFLSKPVRSGARFRLVRVTFPSPVTTEIAENNTVHAEYFQPAGPGPFPACVVLHILGGDFVLAETVASHLARQGVAALFVKMPYYGPRRGNESSRRMISEDPRETVEGMTQGVLDIRRATAWLADRSEVDSARLGITGISLGGIMSALAAAGEPRLQNVAVFLGGGNFAEILWANETERAQAFRKKWLAAGETRESFREVVNQIDPVTYGHLLKGRRVLMIAAKNDEIIPPASAKALWESIGHEPELVWLDAGHYSAIKFLPQELVRLDMFFNGRK